ncbi:MAG: endonuclease/exonuclease/phosphatase family protein [Pararhodobacter sp.]
MRIAVFQSGLGRDGPGLLLRDILRREEDVLAARDVIAAARPDILLLLRFDWDHDGQALAGFAALLSEAGHPMPYHFAPRPNTGWATGLDMDGDGRTGTPDDAQGWGRFSGAGGMALLARLPIMAEAAQDHSTFLWRDLPGALIPMRDGAPFPSAAVFDVQRLSSAGHWQVPLRLPDGSALHVLAWHAGPPAFGGPMQRNRRRNHDETAFWALFLDGVLPFPPPAPPFVLIGNSNLDPEAGDGIQGAMQALLGHPALQDPRPMGPHPQTGTPGVATAYWPRGPGALRVSYILPDAGQDVLDAGLIWPETGSHALVWLDLALPR